MSERPRILVADDKESLRELMTRVLKGEAPGAGELAIALLVSAVVAALGVAYVARQLRQRALA